MSPPRSPSMFMVSGEERLGYQTEQHVLQAPLQLLQGGIIIAAIGGKALEIIDRRDSGWGSLLMWQHVVSLALDCDVAHSRQRGAQLSAAKFLFYLAGGYQAWVDDVRSLRMQQVFTALQRCMRDEG